MEVHASMIDSLRLVPRSEHDHAALRDRLRRAIEFRQEKLDEEAQAAKAPLRGRKLREAAEAHLHTFDDLGAKIAAYHAEQIRLSSAPSLTLTPELRQLREQQGKAAEAVREATGAEAVLSAALDRVARSAMSAEAEASRAA